MKSKLRIQVALVALAAVLVSCGGGSSSPAEVPGTSTQSSGSESPETAFPIAPDFTLTLQPEGEFTLSEAGKPVYMVFWAEW